ncbi:hypothetical protein FUAX_11630 [Fulvitalea axinellae]|uniref:Uncharacterized protein n=1 Tax=Fulvitalea axinellae TaxID=1182444 RepID=A0AAU9CIL0_9BACT|nr:hypothetical protein FUAX_11630 [Fulvitalea axinellae]
MRRRLLVPVNYYHFLRPDFFFLKDRINNLKCIGFNSESFFLWDKIIFIAEGNYSFELGRGAFFFRYDFVELGRKGYAISRYF